MDDEKRHLPSSGRAFLIGTDSLYFVAETIEDAFQESGRGGSSCRFFIFAIRPIARVRGVTGFSLDSTIGRSRESSVRVVAEYRRTAGLPPPSIEVGSACPEDFLNERAEPGVVISGPVGRSDGHRSDEEASQPWEPKR